MKIANAPSTRGGYELVAFSSSSSLGAFSSLALRTSHRDDSR